MQGFGPASFASAGKGTGAAAAAGASNVGANFAEMRKKAPKYDALSAAAMETQSKEKIAGWNAQAQVAGAGVQSLGQVTSSGVSAYGQMRAAEIQAEATKEASQNQMIGSIAGAALGMFSFCDERAKHTIEDLGDALDLLRDLRPVSFYYKPEFTSTPDRQHVGFIAQEFAQVLPAATHTDEESGYLCIDQTQLIGVLVKAVQELESRITELEGAES